MVMHVEVHHENSFFSLDDSINVILVEPEDRDGSAKNVSWTLARDTSDACRDSSMDNTRQTVNTQTSILDLTKEEEDDDEEEDEEEDDSSVLFHDLRDLSPHRLQEDAEGDTHAYEKAASASASASGSGSGSSLLGRFSPDRFFDSLCSAPLSDSDSSSRKPRPPFCSSSPCAGVSCTAPSPSQTHSHDELETETRRSQVTKSASSISLAGDRLAVETDVWNLLGCASPPDVMELEAIWNLTTATTRACSSSYHRSSSNKTKRPLRASLKDRMHRIQRLRQHRWAGATRHGVTLSQHGPYSPSISLRAVSMDQLDSKDYSKWRDSSLHLSAASLANAMGFSATTRSLSPSQTTGRTEPNSSCHHRIGMIMESCHHSSDADLTSMKADGYDSDPEFCGSNPGASSSRMDEDTWHDADDDNNHDVSKHRHDNENRVLADQHHHPLPKVEAMMDQVTPECEEDQDFIIYQTVQQTLNSTWTLTWHPNAENVKEFNIAPKPLMINIWMERGTVITHTGVVIEPMFMWRDAYQSHYLLQQRKRLNSTCQKPWSMRLLNTCRIAPAVASHKKKYPLARKAQCLMVKTCQGQEFFLEANSPSQMELICERWKIAVARFASLAVTEDIDAIAQEFFHPTLSSQTLTVQQEHQQHKQEPLPVEEDGTYLSSASSSSDSMGSSSSSSSSTPRPGAPEITTSHVPVGETVNRRWLDI